MYSHNKILVDAVNQNLIRVAVVDNKSNLLLDLDFDNENRTNVRGNIFLAKITRVEHSLQAAFVDYGGNKSGFLPFSEIHPSYYQIPLSDKERLMDELVEEEKRIADEQVMFDKIEDEEIASELAMEANKKSRHKKPKEEAAVESSESSNLEAASDSTSVDLGSENPAEEGENDDSQEGDEQVSEETSNEGEAQEPAGGSRPRRYSKRSQSNSSSNSGGGNSGGSLKIYSLYKKYNIQEVVKRGQKILVQVTKEERGNKGVSLTTYISLAGKYCVLMPNSPKSSGISRKVTNLEERRRLRDAINNFHVNEGMGVVVRTAGEGQSVDNLKKDYVCLTDLWNQIRENTISSIAPAFIHNEDNILLRVIRDSYNTNTSEVIVEGQSAFNEISKIADMMIPEGAKHLAMYDKEIPIFQEHGVEEQINDLYGKQASLKSGGYIVIEQTEALVSIDVNSGRSTQERNIETTALKTNIEAAHEVARQIKLRDLAGIIVVDFIDMCNVENRIHIEKLMASLLSQDRAKIQVDRISQFGLLAISRQRLNSDFQTLNTDICTSCSGSGHIKTVAVIVNNIFTSIRMALINKNADTAYVSANGNLIMRILNGAKSNISDIEECLGIQIIFKKNEDIGADLFKIEVQDSSSEQSSSGYGNKQEEGRSGGKFARGPKKYNFEKVDRQDRQDRRERRDDRPSRPDRFEEKDRPENDFNNDSYNKQPSGYDEGYARQDDSRQDYRPRAPRRRNSREGGSSGGGRGFPKSSSSSGSSLNAGGGARYSYPGSRPEEGGERRGGRDRNRDGGGYDRRNSGHSPHRKRFGDDYQQSNHIADTGESDSSLLSKIWKSISGNTTDNR